MNTYNLHISRAARTKYGVDESLFSQRGTVVFANFYAARVLALQLNAARESEGYVEPPVQAGELNALGLIHEILHFILQEYRQQRGDVIAKAVARLYEAVGSVPVETTLAKFVDEFPPLAVYRGEETTEEYLRGSTDGVPNREIAVEELILLWLENQNPAAAPFKELFDDATLAGASAYPAVIATLREFFAKQEPFGPERQTLFDVLRAPIASAPTSLSAQLEFMLYRWSAIAGRFDVSRFFSRVVGGIQFIQEEQKYLYARETQAQGGGGFTATTPPVPVFRRELGYHFDERTGERVWFEVEPEKFSPDLDWMPRLVLVAKSTFVWLDQLSKKYEHAIVRLDQIPDGELDELERSGITGIWLIGVWERSKASAQIKHMMGNSDAVASAYSIFDYEIAEELGGPEALEVLKVRAWSRGIRLASDMVPNHMGIDSTWVMEQPDWFIQSADSPYPAYSFNGEDLAGAPGVRVQIEDHYWDRSDAAVVFKRTDLRSGNVRYIYHGNDGTTFPWNDTAQLDYLKATVREQAIQTILRVARQFPVIRFDAAMTLTKRHFQRLWYPTPGEADSIPSRSEHAMTRAEFDELMPEEFWREVVDRVAAEAPDTLLLAEAFWLMEGYFVRSLGMHRVYNSAFMHMLRDERNLEYRLVIKNTLEFDPEVLKRYVNFMNNPDERTAVDQFGKGDKYFGVCVLMVTMPGLPMFGHGQIDGFAERYGMEFRKPMLAEKSDHWLVDRHTREVFPLLHKRYLFAGVENFLLYDVFEPDGSVQENIYSYSNRYRDERALVVYNNSNGPVRGTIRVSAAYRDKNKDELVQRTLGEGLNLRDGENSFVIFRNVIRDEEFIRRAGELVTDGHKVSLGAYEYAVYLDFRQVTDTVDRSYARLHDRLHGRGVPNIEEALRDMNLEPLHAAFRALVNGDILRELRTGGAGARAVVAERARTFVQQANEWAETDVDANAFTESLGRTLYAAAAVPSLPFGVRRPGKRIQVALDSLAKRLADPGVRDGLNVMGFAQALEPFARQGSGAGIVALLDEWQLGRVFAEALQGTGTPSNRAQELVTLIKTSIAHPVAETTDPTTVSILLNDPNVANFLHVNQFNGVMWFNQEAFDALVDWLEVAGAANAVLSSQNHNEWYAALGEQYETWQAWRAAEAQSDYHVDKLLAALAPPVVVRKAAIEIKEPEARPEFPAELAAMESHEPNEILMPSGHAENEQVGTRRITRETDSKPTSVPKPKAQVAARGVVAAKALKKSKATPTRPAKPTAKPAKRVAAAKPKSKQKPTSTQSVKATAKRAPVKLRSAKRPKTKATPNQVTKPMKKGAAPTKAAQSSKKKPAKRAVKK